MPKNKKMRKMNTAFDNGNFMDSQVMDRDFDEIEEAEAEIREEFSGGGADQD